MLQTTATLSRALTSVVRVRLERVPEEDEQVDLPLCDTRTDLLVTAVRPATEADDVQRQLVSQDPSGGGGSEQLVLDKPVPVVAGPLAQVPLLVVRAINAMRRPMGGAEPRSSAMTSSWPCDMNSVLPLGLVQGGR
jgi:hypothetical protein